MAYWWKDSLKSALTYTEQIWYLHQFVDLKEYNILEVFAGMGVSTAPLKKSGKIKSHVGIDHDIESLRAFKSLHEPATTYCTNSYTLVPDLLKKRKFNYIFAEYNAITLYRALSDKKEAPMFVDLFEHGAEYIVFVDSAKVKEHLHYNRYAEFFDSPIYDSATYVEAAGNFIKRKLGYGLIAVSCDGINYSMLFKKNAACAFPMKIMDTRTLVNLKQYKEHVDVSL
jgi:hypothetical protein